MVKVGIIGGSGLDDPQILKQAQDIEASTPYGAPSSMLTSGEISGVPVVILARHGKGHTISPSRIPFRANIHALKEMGVTHILATSACGSLREEIEPGHLVFPDQFIDRTGNRESTFFDRNQVVHTPMADPFCPELRSVLKKTAGELKITSHTPATVVTIEGPRFSTRAESHMFRAWKADIINMSTVPEVCLARELKMHYQTIAMATDYDCWRENTESVTMDMILDTMNRNAERVKKLLLAVIPRLARYEDICNG